jgi:hypothetical protein
MARPAARRLQDSPIHGERSVTKYPQRNQLKHTRKRYRDRNWREYEAALRKRGDLTIWFSEETLRDWHPSVGAIPGGQRHYSDTAIEMALTVRAVYGLVLRHTEGFLRSVARLQQLGIDIPDHTTQSRRSSTLKAPVRNPDTAGGPVHILVDSTGLKAHRGPTAQADGAIVVPGENCTSWSTRIPPRSSHRN